MQSCRELTSHASSPSYAIFTKRKSGHSQKLPDFIKRLEEALYQQSGSKVSACERSPQQQQLNPPAQEEYADATTLEGRLQDVARRFVGKQSNTASTQPAPAMPQPFPSQAQPPSMGMGQSSQHQGQSPMGLGSTMGFVPTPNGYPTAQDSMPAAQRGAYALASNGRGSPALPEPGQMHSSGMPQSGLGGPVMQNGAPVMIKGAMRESFMAQQFMNVSNWLYLLQHAALSNTRNMLAAQARGQASNAGGESFLGSQPSFVPTSSTGMVPMSNGGGMIPTNGMGPLPMPGSGAIHQKRASAAISSNFIKMKTSMLLL